MWMVPVDIHISLIDEIFLASISAVTISLMGVPSFFVHLTSDVFYVVRPNPILSSPTETSAVKVLWTGRSLAPL